MKTTKWLLFILVGLLAACSENETPPEVVGLKPIYGTTDDILNLIKVEEPKPLKNVGKIYIKDNLLFINEKGLGVHVFDNSDPSDPSPLKYIEIPGNVDIAIKGNYMYADMGSGLATLDISDINNLKKTAFDTRYLGEISQHRPTDAVLDLYSGSKIYYECPDVNKGQVIAWVAETMPKPNCFIQR